MNKKVIVIAGYLAAGKSTFALRLSKELQIPYLIKDTFKSALCSNITINNRQESSRFSVVSFDGMMYIMERMFEVGQPLIIEGNFVPTGVKPVDEEGIIENLINQYGYDVLTYQFTGDTRVLYERFMKRENSSEREPVNRMFSEISMKDFDTICHNLDGFHIGGESISVDTTEFDKTDFEMYIHKAHLFMEESL